jgi:putative DNA primase/helicase
MLVAEKTNTRYVPINEIAAYLAYNIERYVKEWYPDGKRNHHEYLMLNNNRGDNSLGSFSINLNTGVWADFATDNKGGDLVSLYAYKEGLGQHEAARALMEIYNIPVNATDGQSATSLNSSLKDANRKARDETQKKAVKYDERLMPVPANAPRPPSDLYHGPNDFRKINHYAPYRDADGNVLCYVARVEKSGDLSKKIIKPLTLWKMPDGKMKWFARWYQTGNPDKPLRPLYGLHLLAQYPHAKALIVEGEKKCDAANKIFESMDWPWVAVSLFGGTGSYKNMDLTPLEGRDCYCWPDNDIEDEKTGAIVSNQDSRAYKVMQYVASQYGGKVLEIPDGYPHKWDVDDALRGKFSDDTPCPKVDDLVGFIEQHARLVESVVVPPEISANDNEPTETQQVAGTLEENEFYVPLGYQMKDGAMEMHFYVKKTNDLTHIKHTSISRSYLNLLAPSAFFRSQNPDPTSKNPYPYIIEKLTRICIDKGLYEPEKARGCGLWQDSSKYLLHMGNYILDGNEIVNLTDIKSSYRYVARTPLNIKTQNTLTAQEGYDLYDLICKFNWERRISPHLLLGWIFLAPVCGALAWRPHIWIYGEKGTGKTTILKNIIGRALRPMYMPCMGGSSEAGIRGYLSTDAKPVVFDEADGDTEKTRGLVDAVIELMRLASSQSDFRIYKGTSDGRSVSYTASSMFCLASIKPGVTEPADKSRVSMLGLKIDSSEEALTRFKSAEMSFEEVIPDGFLDKMLMRAYYMMPKIVETIKMFQTLIAQKLGSNRSGDQYGTLLAGAWAIMNDNVPSQMDAELFMSDWDISEDEHDDIEDTNFNQCIAHLMQYGMRIHAGYEKTELVNVRLGDLIHIAAGRTHDLSFQSTSAMREIRNLGLLVDEDWLYIANGSLPLQNEVFKHTPWAVSYNKILKNLRGAESPKNPKRIFTAGPTKRSVRIPLDTVLGPDTTEVKAELTPAADPYGLPEEWKR